MATLITSTLRTPAKPVSSTSDSSVVPRSQPRLRGKLFTSFLLISLCTSTIPGTPSKPVSYPLDSSAFPWTQLRPRWKLFTSFLMATPRILGFSGTCFERLGELSDPAISRNCNTEEGKIVSRQGANRDGVLPLLWKWIVKPVLDALAFLVAPEGLSRIFWCPALPLALLPIHAAGFYDRRLYSERAHKVFDVDSSYVPTLATPVASLSPATVPCGDLCLFAVRQPASDGQAPLPGKITESKDVKDETEKSPSAQAISVESTDHTSEGVLQPMKKLDRVHFARHGIHDGADSGLCLADQRHLKPCDIVPASHPRGGLAFLSACPMEIGEKNLPDETTIHIAVGISFASCGGDIGRMWSIDDDPALRLARDVYARLFGKDTRLDYRETAGALLETLRGLWEHEVPFRE